MGGRRPYPGTLRYSGSGLGGMAFVFLVYDVQWQRPYAIKVLRPELAEKAENLERFQREALLWVGLGTHPCMVTAEMVQSMGGTACLFLEYVEGGDLASRLAQDLRRWSRGCAGRSSSASAWRTPIGRWALCTATSSPPTLS